MPAAAAVAYFWDERNSILREEPLNTIYLQPAFITGFFGVIDMVLHSIVLAGTLLGIY